MADSGDEGKTRDREMSESHEWDVAAPPYTAPAWIDTDLGEILEPDGDGGNDDYLVVSHVELAMRDLQRHRVRVETGQGENSVYRFGSGDSMLYAIEDGGDRLMIGRGVGRDDEHCIYCLVGTSTPALLAMLDTGEVAPNEAFDHAAELTLCSVFQAGHTPRRHFRLTALNQQVSNVVLVQRYKRFDDVPVEYRPGQPFLHFADE
jgi:hypothetical protein